MTLQYSTQIIHTPLEGAKLACKFAAGIPLLDSRLLTTSLCDLVSWSMHRVTAKNSCFDNSYGGDGGGGARTGWRSALWNCHGPTHSRRICEECAEGRIPSRPPRLDSRSEWDEPPKCNPFVKQAHLYIDCVTYSMASKAADIIFGI